LIASPAGLSALARLAGGGRRRLRDRAVNLSAPFIRRPVATTLLSLAVALAGAVGFRLLPVSPLPEVDYPTIQVSATLPGASPETMASSVAAPLERQFGRIAGVTQMTSTFSSTWPGTSTARPATSRPPSMPPGATCRPVFPATRATARSIRRTLPS